MAKILISAYACEPGRGSEPGVGWNWAEQMSQAHEVWLVTRANNRAVIEASEEKWVSKVHWIYIDLHPALRFWKKGNRGVHLYYYLWQIAAYYAAKRLHREVRFDLVHHVTFGAYWTPSWPGLLPTPFVLGPVGGGEDTPEGLLPSLTAEQRRYEHLRSVSRNMRRFDPVLRRTLRRGAVIAATEETAAKIRPFSPQSLSVLPQCAVSAKDMAYFGRFRPKTDGPFRIASAGRLCHWKGYHLSIMAFKRVLDRFPDAEYSLSGAGPERSALESLVRSLGCERQIKFLGRLPTLDDVYRSLEQADVLVHPALHEAFGVACLEGLAMGRPVICLNRGGPAMQVTPDAGIAVEPTDVEGTVTNLANAMMRFAADPGLSQSMGANARRRVERCLTWERLAQSMNEVYARQWEANRSLRD